MAAETTLYKFKADLKELIRLNQQLDLANTKLAQLKKGTIEYAAAAKSMGGISTQMNKAGGAIKRTTTATRQLNQSGHRMVAIFKSASIAIVAAFAFRAIISGLKGIISTFAKFEQQMAAVKAIVGNLSDEEFKNLTESARELGRTTVFTATQVAELQEEFARLGFTTEQIMAAQQATLDLAAATGENLSSAAAIAGSSIMAFGLEAQQVTRVANVMGAAFTGSALNLERFTQSMKFAAPVAKSAGFTIEETSAMLMTLADAGLHGSIAGNALKNVFIRLADSNSKLNKSIGHTVQGLPQLIVELERMKKETFGLTEATELLDKRSAPAFLVLIDNIKKLKVSSDLLNRAEGDINRMAAIRLDTLIGDFTLLKSATEGLGIAIGETFNLSLRIAVGSLTSWIQELGKSERFLNQVKGTFKLIGIVLTGFIARLAILRISTIANSLTLANFSKILSVNVFKGFSMATLGTRVFALGLKAVKMAIVSTGIGILIVALGELVALLGKTDDSLAQAEFGVTRITKAFNEEVDALRDLGTYTEERHDALRQIVATYGDLVGMIDLEIQSLENLMLIREIADAGSGQQTLIDRANIRIEKIQEERNAKDADFLTDMDNLRKTGEGFDGLVATGEIHFKTGNLIYKKVVLSNAQLIAEEERKRQAMLKSFNDQIEDKRKYVIEKTELRKEELEGEYKSHGMTIMENESYRMDLRMINLTALEDFRASMFDEQVIIEELAQVKLEDLNQARILLNASEDLDKIRLKSSEETIAKYETLYKKMWENSSKQSQDFFNKFIGQQGKIAVNISEFRKHVSSLTKVLRDSGEAFDGSALSPFRLNKTKDRLKELFKFQVSQINDTLKKQVEANERAHSLTQKKYDDEEKLIETNLKSIGGMLENSSLEQMQVDIKANRKKYDALKNLTAERWEEIMSDQFTNKQELTNLILKMQQEEDLKLIILRGASDEEKKAHKNKQLLLEQEILNRERDANLKSDEIKLADMDRTLTNMGNVWKARQALAQKQYAAEKKDLKFQLDNNIITKEQYDTKVLQADRDLAQEQQKISEEKIAQTRDVYSQIADIAISVLNNLAEAKIQGLQDDYDVDVANEETKFNRKLEIAEAAGENTRGMQETHDIHMRALENKKNNEIRDIKKKQFMMEKANAIVMAVINGALAITTVSGQTGIGAIVAAPLMTALIAAQIGAIAAQKFIGAKGGLTPGASSEGSLDKFAEGGMVFGKSHAQGGEKFSAGGKVVELEGGEAVINKRSTEMFKPMLSDINSHNGFGRRFELGGISPGTKAQMDKSTGGWQASDVANLISGAINSQKVFVTEAEITTTQSVVEISESRASIFS